MSIDEALLWLNRYSAAEEILLYWKNETEEARERLTKITPSYEGMSVSGSKDSHKIEKGITCWSHALEAEQQVKRIRTEIAVKIAELEDSRYRNVLREVYLERHTLEQAAKILNYSTKHISRIRKEAVEAIAQILSYDVR